MSKLLGICGSVILVALVFVACKDGSNPSAPRARSAEAMAPSFTMGKGTTSTPLARSTFSDAKRKTLSIKRTGDDWQFDLKAKPAVDVAVQSIVFAAGGTSGWHRHPGPVLIEVVSGTMTFYAADDPKCTPIVRTAGQSYLDANEQGHIARNETASPAQNIVIYFVPPGAPLKIDVSPSPGNCPF